MQGHPDRKGRWEPDRVATVAGAVIVHLFTVAVAAVAVWLAATSWPSPIGLAAAIAVAALAWTIRPRFGRLAPRPVAKRRQDLPALFGVLDRVAASTGSRSPDLVRVDDRVNASWGTVGLRRRRVLTLGWPLWAAATPQQQISLLGHEIAHEVNGDVTHTMIVGSALLTLTEWRRLLHQSGRSMRPTYRRTWLRGELFRLPLLLPAAVPLLVQRLIESAQVGTSQRAEYRADELAARTGGTEATAQMMQLLLLASSIELALQRAAHQRVSDRVTYLRAELSGVPGSELERLGRVGERRGHRVDSTHPPTHLRRAFIASLPRCEAAVTMSAEEAGRVDTEVLGPRSGTGDPVGAV